MTTDKKRDFLINVAYAAVIILLVYFIFKYAVKWVMPFVIAFIISAILYPLIKKLAKVFKIKSNKRPLAAVVTALFYIVIGALLGFIVNRIIAALSGFISYLSEQFMSTILPALKDAYGRLQQILQNMNIEVDMGPTTFFDSVKSGVSSLFSGAVSSLSYIKSIPGLLFSVIIMIISTFFMAMDFDQITRFCLAQLPRKTADFIVELKDYTVKVLFKYIRSYALILSITFGELLIGFTVMHFVTGLKNVFLLSLLIAIFDILPIVGTGTVVIPWAIVSLIIGDYKSAVCLIIIYAVITVVRQFIEPKIVGQQVGLHPIATLIAMIVGSRLFGGIGLIGLPVTLAIMKDLNDHGKIHIFKPVSAYKSGREDDADEKAEIQEKEEKEEQK